MPPESKNRGGSPPFGFRWSEGELVHTSNEATVYALIFELFLIHQRKSKVATLLNVKGLRTRAGKEFSYSTIKRLLTNPVAKGVQRSSVSELNEYGERTNIVREKSIPSIVSVDIWNHVQAILSEQSGTQTRSPTQDLFVGKVVCQCDSIMELPSKSLDYRCFSCDAKISIEDVHTIVERELVPLTLPDSKELRNTASTSLLDSKTDSTLLLKQVKRDIDKLFSLHSKDAVSDEVFKERHDVLNQRKEQLLQSLKESNKHKFTSSMIDQWRSLQPDLKRIIVENLVDQVLICEDKVTASLYPLFNFAQQVNTSRP